MGLGSGLLGYTRQEKKKSQNQTRQEITLQTSLSMKEHSDPPIMNEHFRSPSVRKHTLAHYDPRARRSTLEDSQHGHHITHITTLSSCFETDETPSCFPCQKKTQELWELSSGSRRWYFRGRKYIVSAGDAAAP